MTRSAQRSAPQTSVPTPQRIVLLDVLRGFAVLGILIINIALFARPSADFALPGLLSETPTSDLISWVIAELTAEGAMRAIFSMLFGAAAVIFLTKQPDPGQSIPQTDLFVRRCLWLMVFGAVHAYLLLWVHDILFPYGLFGLLLIPFVRLAPRSQLLIAAGLLCVSAALAFSDAVNETVFQAEMSPAERVADAEQFRNKMRDSADQELDDSQLPYIEQVIATSESVVEAQTIDLYADGLFDIAAFMLIGMALFQLGLLGGAAPRRVFIRLMLYAYPLAFLINGWEVWIQASFAFEPLQMIFWTGVTYESGRLALALGHIGLIGTIVSYGALPAVTGALAKVGRTALSCYVLQTVICQSLFLGLGFFGELPRMWDWAVVAGVWAVLLIFAHAWLARFEQGPLEWLWRSLVLWRRLPLKRAVQPGGATPSTAAPA